MQVFFLKKKEEKTICCVLVVNYLIEYFNTLVWCVIDFYSPWLKKIPGTRMVDLTAGSSMLNIFSRPIKKSRINFYNFGGRGFDDMTKLSSKLWILF